MPLDFMGNELNLRSNSFHQPLIFSFVHMESEATASAAVAALNKTTFKGCCLNLKQCATYTDNNMMQISASNVKETKSVPAKIVVFNLNYKIREAELKSLFCIYGHVIKCHIKNQMAQGKGNVG